MEGPVGRFKNVYELLNLRALKISMLYKNHIFQCMGKIFCVKFQRVPLKFHIKYLTHTLINQSIKSNFVKGAGAHPQNAPCRRRSHALRKATVRRGRLL